MTSQAIKTLGRFVMKTKFDRGTGACLPEAYKIFYKEWKETEPTAVHYIPEEGKWKRNEITGEVKPIQNRPIPLRFPPEADEQIWGGEGLVQGFIKRSKWRRRVPHFWFPELHRSVVYSEVLDKHISVIVTQRALNLIHENYGFDHYLLKTLACDLQSLLALGLKRKILHDLSNKCPAYQERPEKQQEVYDQYKKYLDAYTPEEIEWYGYSFEDACKKWEAIVESQKTVIPLKHVFRAQFVEKLRLAEKEKLENKELESGTSWVQRINPFSKKPET